MSKYFLDNGFDLNGNVEDAVISLAYSLEYLTDPKEAPIELLELVYICFNTQTKVRS